MPVIKKNQSKKMNISKSKPIIVIATGNQNKFAQLVTLLKPLTKKYDFKNLKEINYKKEIIEDGKTFKDNCLIKAKQLVKDTKCIAIADDSGICIDALNGEPGVYSARYAGENAPDEKIVAKVMKKLQGVPLAKRNAKFVAVVGCVLPNGKSFTASGEIKGKIPLEPVYNKNGDNGLTYDPIFIPNGYKKTMSLLSHEERIKINHRGIAVVNLLKKIKNI
ncbi:MAG: RdgB/HAM1 family non-canonical purine NTP pyrophosphatase [Mycoplasmataceae bacterium]|jgi:XTP/dITP diphosphohydrolase|nr:RdgB/HAM1 family non-canonical purine NTP pyrophosphatase [Mycoplasmataceae bacterium]